MSGWNHRVVRRASAGDEWLMVCEVYYREDGTPAAHTVDAIGVAGESLIELQETIARIEKALTQPILNEGVDFKGFDGEEEVESEVS